MNNNYITAPVFYLSFYSISLISFHKGSRRGGRNLSRAITRETTLPQEEKWRDKGGGKMEFLHPLQEGQPMNQQNKFSPEINKHDISVGRERTGEGRCHCRKVQDASDRKNGPAFAIKKVCRSEAFIAGFGVMKQRGESSHTCPRAWL